MLNGRKNKNGIKQLKANAVYMEMEKKLTDNNFSEALYNEKRNAIPSWQGYEYQGKVAIRRYLELLSGIFASGKSEEQMLTECREIKLKIEWLEDFIIFRDENISEIYQVKKTLTKSTKEEVIANFILQFKFLQKKDIQWFLAFDDVDQQGLDGTLSEEDFLSIYSIVIEQGFAHEVEELKNNRDVTYWKENLDLQNKKSSCKKSRMYLRRLFELESNENRKIEYGTQQEVDEICEKYLDMILNMCKMDEEDYQDFSSKLHIIHIPIDMLREDCKNYIENFPESIKCNRTLSIEDIFQKMLCDINEKLETIKSKKEKENYIYCFEDVKRVCRDEDNTKYKWHFRLCEIKEEFLNEFVKVRCNKCPKNKNSQDCIGCIYAEIKNWNMETLIDAMNLEYPKFRVEKALQSNENKISDLKIDLMMDMIESFETTCKISQNEIISVDDGRYFLSSILNRRSIVSDLLSNYWEHTEIYRDFLFILTDDLDYGLDEESVSFLKENYEKIERDEPKLEDVIEKEKMITFLDTRRTKFVKYKEVNI